MMNQSMPTSQQIENALKRVHDQQSFFQDLLATTLEWPLADVQQIGDIAYGWSQSDLNATGLERSLIEGSIWQIQPSAAGQPWGVFVLEFKDESTLSPRGGLAGVLRTVLKGLVGFRRKDAGLPSWKREHLLFICTHDWKSFRFAYYRTKPDEPRSARLTTFGWSPDTSNRTVVEFNLPSLVWPEDTTDGQRWVSAWAKAFDKEPLTKDFFRRFDNALEVIKADLQTYQSLSSAAAYTQSQLLLERLIFLYFLQNRGWLNQDHRYLASRLPQHTDNADEFTYYTDFLDKLFWTLSTAPSGADRLPGVPFLNGGLFDDDEFRQPAISRKTTPPLKVRNRSMRFVFQELLEAFNFTVTEDTPLNQEVAVDPEMLGKVFESIILHAEAADPDAIAPDKRKATGSYYTPRIVVHFICQEVLYQYLLSHLPGEAWGSRLKVLFSIDPTEGIDEEGKQLLRKAISPQEAVQIRDLVVPLKCCDPAVGSGAFPVGLMHELVNLRRLLETVANGYKDPVVGQGPDWLHQTKAQIVENCLFGVDIQQQAIEICRLRLWLSLIVDYDLGLDPFKAEKSQFSRAIERISQLPNLEMNFRRGDSLHDHISGVPVVILPERASRHAADFAAISKLGKELHKAKKSDRKRNLRLAILEKRLSLSRSIVGEELREIRTRDSSLDSLFGVEESNSKKRERNQRQIENLERALAKVEADQKELEKLKRRDADSHFYPKLRKLEGADFDSPFNFAWRVDFPSVFTNERSGFDLIVGNPPFVTARNATKRALWAQRWPRVCYKNYLLVCPFFELSFGLLKPCGELGFIVSNAFAKRDFGKPLVEAFFPSVDLQKIVDCSGLLFPGHGTPTYLIFGRMPNGSTSRRLSQTVHEGESHSVRVATILPGGGDLRTPPEESALWRTLSEKHDEPGFANTQVAVFDRTRKQMCTWPWKFIQDTGDEFRTLSMEPLSAYCAEPVGAQFITGKDDAFVMSADYIRRAQISPRYLKAYGAGEDIRNWVAMPKQFIIFPYQRDLAPLQEPLPISVHKQLAPYKEVLENCVISGSTKKKETNLKWFEFRRLARGKFAVDYNLVVPHISTHAHFAVVDHAVVFKEKALAIALKVTYGPSELNLLAALLNSSFVLERLKQVCFNKGAGDDEDKDRFEFAGGKLEEILICESVTNALCNQTSTLSSTLEALGRGCMDRGRRLGVLSLEKLFHMPEEAYMNIYQTLPGYVPPDQMFHTKSDDIGSLGRAYVRVKDAREQLRVEMIARQEEIDWLVYRLYGLLSEDHPAAQVQPEPQALREEYRPFRLWEKGQLTFGKALSLIPKDWSDERKRLWEARLAAIRDSEHIRSIEQPVYKRRWDEQWKVGNSWRSGDLAYSAEFISAFEYWLMEKAEWWLENKKHGPPIEFGDWAQALWMDDRIRAAWLVAAEQYSFLEYETASEKAEENGSAVPVRRNVAADSSSFTRKFKKIVEEETVPEGFPGGVDYDELTRRLKREVPAKLKRIRGKLNVARERFHSVGPGQYKWAGLQFKAAPQRAAR
jgi:hypothetical protein